MTDHNQRMPAQPRYDRDDYHWNGHQSSLESQAWPPMRQAPMGQPAPQAPARRTQKIAMTGAEQFWYVLQNIPFGAGYFCKIPVKKALVDYGLVPELTGAEQFWYVLMNIGFGSGYFAKVIISKALSELPQFQQARQGASVQARFDR